MKKTPSGWPRISSAVFYDDAPKAIDWLCAAFGFQVRLKVEGDPGVIHHSELTYGDGVVMVGSSQADHKRVSPRRTGGANTQALFLYVDGIDAHCEHARKAGAKILTEPETKDYGEGHWIDRGYECEDPEGHRWWFAERMS